MTPLQTINKLMERIGFKESLFVVGFLLLVLFLSLKVDIFVGLIVAVVGIRLWQRWYKKNIQKQMKATCLNIQDFKEREMVKEVS